MIDLIKGFESFSEIAYLCPAGYWTYGYGSRYKLDGTPVKQGDTITRQAAEALLNDYLIKNVHPLFRQIPYSLTQNQKDAICSLVFNVGKNGFINSKLFKAIKEKDYENICRQWDWFKCNGKVVKGLVVRRVKELYLFIKDI